MDTETRPLHILFFPLMAPGHMNPMIDMAKLFTRHGVKATILTTPANVPLIQPAVDSANQYSTLHNLHHITITVVPFPSRQFGLPEGCENVSSIPSPEPQPNFTKAIPLLRQPFDQVLTKLAPDCLISDIFLPWTCDVAAEHSVPRIVFHGMSFFALCASESLRRHKPLESLPPHAESFILPGLPHRIEMLRTQIADPTKVDPTFLEMLNQSNEAVDRSYGVIVNSFYELEPDYAEHYQKVIGRRSWHVGPVSLCNEDEVDMSRRGNTATIDCEACLKWLDGKASGSVVYFCFGSMGDITEAQLREIALGLEASNHPFIWVVRSCSSDSLPKNFDERIEGKGMIIRGWVPQVLILNHRAVGGFVTHCGWNSCLEGLSSGVPLATWPLTPLATWPLFAEQFYNERLIVDVLRIGVSIGVKRYASSREERAVVVAPEIEKVVNELMGSGEKAESRRRKARSLGEMARRVVKEGGSSYIDMENFIKELEELKYKRGKLVSF